MTVASDLVFPKKVRGPGSTKHRFTLAFAYEISFTCTSHMPLYFFTSDSMLGAAASHVNHILLTAFTRRPWPLPFLGRSTHASPPTEQ